MRRLAVIALLVLPVVALVVGWRIWTRPPALVVSLRALPEVAKVEYTGSVNAPLVVVHFLDWHFVPPDLCKLDGIDFEANLDAVETSLPLPDTSFANMRSRPGTTKE